MIRLQIGRYEYDEEKLHFQAEDENAALVSAR